MNKLFVWLMNPPTDGPKSTLLLRLMAGGVFFWEGLLKFVYVNQGVGRFTKLGIPFPHFTAAFIGYLEIFGGLLLLSGLMTRLIAVPFIGEMIVAVLSTKISLYLGTSPLPLPPRAAAGGLLGRAARDPIRLCADSDGHLSAGEWPGKMVAGCSAAAAVEKKRRVASCPVYRAWGSVAGCQSLKALAGQRPAELRSARTGEGARPHTGGGGTKSKSPARKQGFCRGLKSAARRRC